MTLCETVFDQKDEWRAHSVYPLPDDSDRDFEFYVFVEPGKDEQRPLFLKVLEQAIQEPNTSLNGETLSQFKEWTGTEDRSIATAINWIKIAIEQYPMRLFVVRDAIPNNTLHPFLKKRICWIEHKEFGEKLEGDKEKFKLWLHAQWVKHLIENVREDLQKNNCNAIRFEFVRFQMADPPAYLPSTLPDCLKHSNAVVNDSVNIINLDLNGVGLVDCSDNNVIVITIARHENFWFWENKEGWHPRIYGSRVYGESFSGVLSYGGRLIEAAAKPNDHLHFLLSLADAALLRLGIADERFQEWWGNNEVGTKDPNLLCIGNILAQRVIVVFWEKVNEYGQRRFPGKAYAIYTPPNKVEFSVKTGQNGNSPWSQQNHGIDLLVVHQGILDTWRKGASKQVLTKEVLQWKEVLPWIVITSGRGRPETVPYGVKFLPFAGLEACMVGKYFEKYTLIRQIAVIVEEGKEK